MLPVTDRYDFQPVGVFAGKVLFKIDVFNFMPKSQKLTKR